MYTNISDPLAVGILVASIDVSSSMPVTAAIETLVEKDLTLDAVTEWSIEEHKIEKDS